MSRLAERDYQQILQTGLRPCTKCGGVKSLDCFDPYPRSRVGVSGECRVCRKQRRNDPARKEAERQKRQSTRVKRRAAPLRFPTIEGQARHKQMRRLVLREYGERCACCGETEPNFLCVDHIFNDGAEHRRGMGRSNIYAWLIENGYPKNRFQLLCYNCNMAKQFYGECPHSKQVIPFPVAC